MLIHLTLSTKITVFPEQESNWNWIENAFSTHRTSTSTSTSTSTIDNPIRVLNGFAYTGGSTLACLSAHPS